MLVSDILGYVSLYPIKFGVSHTVGLAGNGEMDAVWYRGMQMFSDFLIIYCNLNSEDHMNKKCFCADM